MPVVDNELVLKLKHVIRYLKEKPEAKQFFPRVTRLVKILITIPGTSCTNERCFSTLRRLKDFLRSTMAEDRLNDLTILNIYRDILNAIIDLEKVMNVFIQENELHLTTFALN